MRASNSVRPMKTMLMRLCQRNHALVISAAVVSMDLVTAFRNRKTRAVGASARKPSNSFPNACATSDNRVTKLRLFCNALLVLTCKNGINPMTP